MIEFTKLLGAHLKDNSVVEVIESYDINVIYDFARPHDDIDDSFWAGSKGAGFNLHFDKNLVLTAVFLYLAPREGFSPVREDEIDITVFKTFDEAEREYKENGIPYEASQDESGMHKLWIKRNCGSYTIHHQFENGAVCLVTLQSKI